ncbi:MAG TPA: transposase, partial [Anaerolineales bacterium]
GQLVNRLSTQSPEVQEPPVEQRPLQATYDAPTEHWEDDNSLDTDMPSIADILSDVPPPRPEPRVRAIEEEDFYEQPATTRSPQYSHESSPAVRAQDLMLSNQDQAQTVEHVVEDFDATIPSQSRRRPETPIRKPRPEEMAETRLSPTTEAERRITLEPISAGLYHLTYACLLVPRFAAHYLTGDLADRIAEWLPTICVAFGWRLEYLAVRPEYLQWVVNVQPNTSPGTLMRVVRQQTSEKIFSEIPRLSQENPSGDFWAPGYLIMGGTQPHPPQLVRDYIKQARERQGILRPRG